MSKTILITGASSGIGKETAKKFQAKGWNVIATMRTPENETELNKLDNVLVNTLDVQNLETINAAIEEGVSKFGKIDVVLNNAGYGIMGTFESATRESVTRQFDVNVLGLFDVTRARLPHFRKNKNGMFINISSVGGKMTFPLMPLYHATKFAVEGFSESLHYEMKAIGVKLIEPGTVNTDFGGRSLDLQHDKELKEYNKFFKGTMKSFEDLMDPDSMSSPEQIADVIFTAATDNSNTLRYRAGADAEQLLTARKNMSDGEFVSMMESQLNLQ
ncbi:short-chain dehydrogenase/reductase [Patiriisocius marinistellae]|uniref:Short-chain dehydrogenase/reductase n=1 Tax=Patiriisocius marinistellae TaxID=2494560 RepID=A0A5J4FV99_9FLAO|nr:SDR family oxidoreductase [Patiriisocius marinistellae]GEQ85004.1 short-chain dehydrogenase/reductase [Patiriisocius marinistellae]